MPLVPFTAHIPDSAITDLRERLARTRWPEAETVDDWSQGVPLNYLKDVCDYWADDYDWRSFETKLNSFEQGITTIEGLDIHYVHAPSPEPNAKPLHPRGECSARVVQPPRLQLDRLALPSIGPGILSGEFEQIGVQACLGARKAAERCLARSGEHKAPGGPFPGA